MCKVKTSWQKKVLKAAAKVHASAVMTEKGIPPVMTGTRALLVAVLAFGSACSQDALLLGPHADTPTVSTSGVRSPITAQSAGRRLPNSPSTYDDGGVVGTAHCRDCGEPMLEPFFLALPAGRYVQAGEGMCLEVHGVTPELSETYHVHLRYSDPNGGDFFDEQVHTYPVVPCFFMARRGFWRVDAYRRDGASAHLGDLPDYAW